jgi:putative ABC transport system permease protein
MLGVAAGVAAIVALSSLGQGLESAMKAKMQRGFEVDVLPVMAGGLLTGGSAEFMDADVERLGEIQGVAAVSPVIQKTGIVPYAPGGGSNSTAWMMLAVDLADFWRVYPERLSFETGALPDDPYGNVAILGHDVQHLRDGGLLGSVGSSFEIEVTLTHSNKVEYTNHTFIMAGVLESRGATDFINFDNTIFIPTQAAKEIYGIDNADMLLVRIQDPARSDEIAHEIEKALEPRDVRVLVPTAFMEQVDSILSMLDKFHITISSVALLVAGVGIMNIMTVSVMERIRDIGIMKAIGARDNTILLIFLTEASLVGLAAALMGVPIGLGVAHGLSGFLFNFTLIPQEELLTGVQPPPFLVHPMPSTGWILGAAAVGVVVSIVFGLYPAHKAAKLDPIKAIRYE